MRTWKSTENRARDTVRAQSEFTATAMGPALRRGSTGGWHGQSPQTGAAVQALSHVPLTSLSEDQGRDPVPFYV